MLSNLSRRSRAALRASFLGLVLLSTGPLDLALGEGKAEALAFETWLHGSSLMGEPKYPPGFAHFDYVNPDAPKGGVARLAAQGGFDSFNAIIPKGEAASGLALIYDTLMVSAYDEISSDYGLIAEAMYVGENYSYVKYRLREGARWHDGEPITAEDVVWSFETLTELNPQQKFYYSHVTKAEVTGEREVTFTFDEEGNRELPHIVGQLLILPKHWWAGTDADGKQRDISNGTLEPPLGSGAYKIKDFSAGKYVEYERVPDYWARDLNVAIGYYNFDVIRFDLYRDATVLFEAFKSDNFDFRVENTAKNWATGYNFPAVEDGRVKRELIPDNSSGITGGFWPNLRREKFQDARVRQALNYVYNFEEMNRTLFFSQYERINSYYFGTELAATGLPSEAELALLEPLRDKIPASVFDTPFENPKVESREDLRDNLKKALDLFAEAGWEPKTEIDEEKRETGFFHSIMVALGLRSDPTKIVMRNEAGDAFEIEFLVASPAVEKIALRLQDSLQRIGVTLDVRVVDSAQYVNRIRGRDFDMAYLAIGQSLSPGNEQREYFGSESADRDGSANYAGIKNEAVDQLIEHVIFAKDRDGLIAAARALDRVLLANHYNVPTWHQAATRIAYWDRFGHPDPLPLMTSGFPTIWWWEDAKAAAVEAKQ